MKFILVVFLLLLLSCGQNSSGNTGILGGNDDSLLIPSDVSETNIRGAWLNDRSLGNNEQAMWFFRNNNELLLGLFRENTKELYVYGEFRYTVTGDDLRIESSEGRPYDFKVQFAQNKLRLTRTIEAETFVESYVKYTGNFTIRYEPNF